MNDNIRLAISGALGAAIAAGVALGVAKTGTVDPGTDTVQPPPVAPVIGRVEMNRNAGVCNGYVIDPASGAADPQLTGCDVLDAVDAAVPSPQGATQVNRAVIEVHSDGTCDVSAGRYTPQGSASTERAQGVQCNLLPLPQGLTPSQQ